MADVLLPLDPYWCSSSFFCSALLIISGKNPLFCVTPVVFPPSCLKLPPRCSKLKTWLCFFSQSAHPSISALFRLHWLSISPPLYSPKRGKREFHFLFFGPQRYLLPVSGFFVVYGVFLGNDFLEYPLFFLLTPCPSGGTSFPTSGGRKIGCGLVSQIFPFWYQMGKPPIFGEDFFSFTAPFLFSPPCLFSHPKECLCVSCRWGQGAKTRFAFHYWLFCEGRWPPGFPGLSWVEAGSLYHTCTFLLTPLFCSVFPPRWWELHPQSSTVLWLNPLDPTCCTGLVFFSPSSPAGVVVPLFSFRGTKVGFLHFFETLYPTRKKKKLTTFCFGPLKKTLNNPPVGFFLLFTLAGTQSRPEPLAVSQIFYNLRPPTRTALRVGVHSFHFFFFRKCVLLKTWLDPKRLTLGGRRFFFCPTSFPPPIWGSILGTAYEGATLVFLGGPGSVVLLAFPISLLSDFLGFWQQFSPFFFPSPKNQFTPCGTRGRLPIIFLFFSRRRKTQLLQLFTFKLVFEPLFRVPTFVFPGSLVTGWDNPFTTSLAPPFLSPPSKIH